MKTIFRFSRSMKIFILFFGLHFALLPIPTALANNSPIAHYDPGARGTSYPSQSTYRSSVATLGAVASELRQVGTPAGQSNIDRYVAFQNPGPSLNPNNYLTFNITPIEGRTVSIAKIEFSTISYYGNGNTNSSIRWSIDSYQRDLGKSTFLPRGNGGKVIIDISPPVAFTDPATFRIYMWGSTNDWSDIAGGGAVSGAEGLRVLGSVTPIDRTNQNSTTNQVPTRKCSAVSSWNGNLSSEMIAKATDMINANSKDNAIRIEPAVGNLTSIVLDCSAPTRIGLFTLWYDRSSPLDNWPVKWSIFGSNSNSQTSWSLVFRNAHGGELTAAASSGGWYISPNSEYRFYRFVIDEVSSPSAKFVAYQDISIAPTLSCLAIGKSPKGSSPSFEDFQYATDGLPQTKYLNFSAEGENNSLFLDCGSPVGVSGVRFKMANDEPKRDPKRFTIWGSNDNPLTSNPTWLRIGLSNSDVTCPSITAGKTTYCNRYEESNLTFLSISSAGLKFRFLKLVIDEVRGPNADSVQYAEVKMMPANDLPTYSSTSSTTNPSVSDSSQNNLNPVKTSPNEVSDANSKVKSATSKKATATKTKKTTSKVAISNVKKTVKVTAKTPAKAKVVKITCLKGSLSREFISANCPSGWIRFVKQN